MEEDVKKDEEVDELDEDLDKNSKPHESHEHHKHHEHHEHHSHSDHSHEGHSHPGHSHDKGDDIISIKKDTLWKYSTFILIAVVIIGSYFAFGGSTLFGNGDVIGDQPPTVLPPVGGKVEVSIDDDAVKGDVNAPVTIIEFTDYECPFCSRHYTSTMPQLQKEYIDTGKVKYVVRDFPLGFHTQAQKSAEAAECAGEQGKYFEMHDKLFDNGVQGGVSSFKQFAGQIGLNQGDFDSCLDSDKMASEVQKDSQDGQKYGVQGTPAFFINGRLISGAQPFSAFKQAIDAEL